MTTERDLRALFDERLAKHAAAQLIIDTAYDAGRDNLTEDEARAFDGLHDDMDFLRNQIERLERREAIAARESEPEMMRSIGRSAPDAPAWASTMLAEIITLRNQVEQMNAARRRPLSAGTRRLHDAVLTAYYRGNCPAAAPGDEHPIQRTEYDHFLDRNDNRPEATWKICRTCHQLRTHNPVYREDCRAAFGQYQRALRHFLGIQPDLFGPR